MAAMFSANEVLQIALELEDTGQVFYEALAAATRNERVADLCRRLAAQELEHYGKFKTMRSGVAGAGERPPLQDDDVEYVQGLLNARVVPDRESARRAAAGPLGDTLRMAIKMETDSVNLYTRIRALVAEKDAPVLAGIIREERQHEQDLATALRGLG